MIDYAVIIPTRSCAKATGCIEALRSGGCKAPIIIVNDGDTAEERHAIADLPLTFPMKYLYVIFGAKPFVYARNVNIGIRFAGDRDVFLLNDDARLQRGDIEELAIAAQDHNYGLVAAATVGLTNDFQRPVIGTGIRRLAQMIPFVSVYMRAVVVDRLRADPGIVGIGPLDERFVGYGYDDDDACLRLQRLRYQLGIYDAVVFEHGSVPSEYRGMGPAGSDKLAQNRAIFEAKWPDVSLC